MENASSLLLNMASGPLLPAELSLDSLPVDGKIRVLHGKTIMVCWRAQVTMSHIVFLEHDKQTDCR